MSAVPPEFIVRRLGRVAYEDSMRAMQVFTARRTTATADELWLLDHSPVYTMGLKGRGQVPPDVHGIPVVQTDRGGDMTYHGPGQLVGYVLVDLTRRRVGIKRFVVLLEQAMIDLLGASGIAAERRPGAPGVYVGARKIASLGLRVRNGASYHGLALNVDCDLTPFRWIDPCGQPGLRVTSLQDLGVDMDMARAGRELAARLADTLGYTDYRFIDRPTETEAALHE